jgi:hypothetical protein
MLMLFSGRMVGWLMSPPSLPQAESAAAATMPIR